MSIINYLVLSGGGQTLFNYIGIFQTLFKSEYIDINSIKSIYGTSSGAIIGAFLCLKYEWDDIVDYIIRCPWENKLKVGINKALKIFEYNGLYDDDLFICIFKSLLCGKNLTIDVTMKEFYEYSNINLHVFTFEINDFIKVDISHKTHPDLKLLDALRMSCSIPLLIKPICCDGKCYIDGGIQVNYPLSECLENEGCNEVNVLGVKNFNNNILKQINSDSNITDYFHVILKRTLKVLSQMKNEHVNDVTNELTNEIQLYTEGISFEIIMDALFDKDKRKQMVNTGTSTADLFLQYNKKIRRDDR